MGYAEHDRGRPRPGPAGGGQVRPSTAFMGPAAPAASEGVRPGRGTSTGAGVTAGARSDAAVRVCVRGDFDQGPVVVDLDVASRAERRMGGAQGDRYRGGAGGPGAAAAGA